jgi:signal transduction histidine kinase
LLFYPLWSWRRQEAALHFLSAELARLEQEPGLLSVVALARSGRQHLDDRMRAVYRMSSRLRDLRRFLADGIEGLPDATVICDLDGRVLLANGSCIKLAQSAGDLRNGMSPTWHVRALISAVALRPEPGLAYWESLRRAFVGKPVAAAEHPAAGVELQARNQRSMLLRGAPLRSDTGGLAGLIISLTDITQVRMAERRREETLRFLSHDMRSPQASILALIDLQAEPSHAMPLPALLSRISEHASRTLDLADEFIQLARAEAYSLKSVDLDLAGVVLDATDELWALATRRRTTVNVEVDEDHPTVSGDPVLLTRAVANLVGNAIKYGPPAGVVTVRVARRGGRIAIDVSDQGPGIDATDQLALFHPFVRLQDGKPDAPKGSGLGLVFVKTVVERHGGEMLVRSKPGAGSTFTILLPENARAAS